MMKIIFVNESVNNGTIDMYFQRLFHFPIMALMMNVKFFINYSICSIYTFNIQNLFFVI